MASTPASVDTTPTGTTAPFSAMSGAVSCTSAELAASNPRINILHREKKQGLGRAYLAGFRWALERPQYQFIMEMDADFSHDPKAVAQLREAAQDADLVLGSRYVGGLRVINWPLNRLILSTGAAFYVRMITGMPFTDPTGGFKCFRREVLAAINLDEIHSNGYSFQIEMVRLSVLMVTLSP